MLTLTNVLFNALWILGLAGVLATFSYMDWYRSRRGWRWRQMWRYPLLLTPLALSLTLFGLGMTLSAAARPRDPLWQIGIWGVLTLMVTWQTLLFWRAGRSGGWTTPLAGDGADSAGQAKAKRGKFGAT